MTFITTTQLRDALAPDGNVVGTAAELGEGQLTDAINEAQNKVSAYVGDTFTDTNAPALVRDLVTALSIYYVTFRYRKGKPLSQYHPVVLRYADALLTLKDILDGNISVTPPLDTSPTPTTDRPSLFNPLNQVTRGRAPQTTSMFGISDFGLQVSGGQGTVTVEESRDSGYSGLDEY